MGKPIGLYIEATGIQDYIFSSNKLKLNLGASYIIEHLLMDKLLLRVVNSNSDANKDNLKEWFIKTEEPELVGEKIRIGFSGGGGCLLFCDNRETAEKFIADFSLEVLLNFPGITLSATILAYDASDEQIKEELKKGRTLFQAYMTVLIAKLNKERSQHHIVSFPISPGYVRKDLFSLGYVDPIISGNTDNLKSLGNKNIAVSTLSKIKAVNKAVLKHNENFLDDKKGYSFPLEFDDVCMEDDQGFIAVVHIDGNGIGRQFMSKKNLKEYQELSNKTKIIGKETISKTVSNLIDVVQQKHSIKGMIGELIDDFQKRNFKNKEIELPFRPIISGGDDITFVTDGRLGLYLAKKCIENFISVTKEILGEEFHACAGVAIVKRKYPFIRAYHLAEELIKNAKKASRAKEGEKYSYIDMYISNSGISGSLDAIRSQTHSRWEDKKEYVMNYGPYLIKSNQENTEDKHTYDEFIHRMGSGLSTASQSKVQQLRTALYSGVSDRETYMNRLKELDREFYEKLLDSAVDGEEFLFLKEGEKKITPWIDAIDYRDFYPLGIEEKTVHHN